MTPKHSHSDKNLSLWQKIKAFFNLRNNNYQEQNSNDESGDSESESDEGGEGVGKLEGQAFADTGLIIQTVKEPETILYDELKKDHGALHALKALTNGQIPVSEAAAIFEKVRNSEVALDAIINSEFAPPDVKAKAREEKAQLERKKLQAQEGFKKPPPRPGF